MHTLEKIVHRTVALTQNSWTKVSNPASKLIKLLDVPNPNGYDVQLHYGNPWCLSFDGGDYVDIDVLAADATLLASVGGVISADILPTNTAGAKTIVSFSRGTVTNACLKFYLDASEKLCATCQAAAAAVKWTLNTNVALSVAEWQHVKLWHDGITPKLFVNGAQIPYTVSVSTDLTYWFSDLSALINTGRIGSIYMGGAEADLFTGKIANVRIAAGLEKSLPGGLKTISSYSCETGSGTSLVDSTGSYDGTFGAATAAPTWSGKSTGQPLWDGITSDDIIRPDVWAYTTELGASLEVTEGW